MKTNLQVAIRRGGAVGAACVAALLMAAVAQAQVQPVLGGRVLDANPMVGSGGTNNPVAGYVPVNGNDIITGNVTGLGYFHGRVPYSSPYESSLNGTGADASFNRWLRESAGSTVNSGPYLGQAQPFFLQSQMFATHEGRIAPGMVPNTVNGGNGVTITGPQAINPTAVYHGGLNVKPGELLPIGAALPSRNFQRVGAEPVSPYTDSGEVSPLYGLRPGIDYEIVVPGAAPTEKTAKPKGTANEGVDDETPVPVRTDIGVSAQRKGLAPGEKPLRQRVDDELAAATPRDAFVGQTNKPPAKALFGNGLRVSAEYAGVVADLQAREAEPSAAQEPVGSMLDTLTIKAPGNLETGAARTKSRAGNTAPGGAAGTTGAGNGVGGAAGAQAAARQVPEIPAPAIEAPTVKTFLATAAAQMQKGKYFDAADTYQRALDVDPNNTTAAVGRADAELGGGLYESAAYDYRALFQAQPSLLTARHELATALGARRIGFLRKDLTELIGRSHAPHASFLLAYIDYQTGDSAGVKATLDTWAKADPRNAWVVELRKAWLK